jgi:hypothetical protein
MIKLRGNFIGNKILIKDKKATIKEKKKKTKQKRKRKVSEVGTLVMLHVLWMTFT